MRNQTKVSTKSRAKLQNKAWAFVTEFLGDESGQSTTEYVLLLLFVVVAVKAVGGGLKDKLQSLIGKVFEKTDQAVEQTDTGN